MKKTTSFTSLSKKLIACFFCIFSINSFAAEILDQTFTLPGSATTINGTGSGQSFTAGYTGPLTKIIINIKDQSPTASSSDIRIRIIDGAGSCGTTILADETFLNITEFQNYSFNLSNPPNLTIGQTYTILLSTTDGSLCNIAFGTGGYPNGDFYSGITCTPFGGSTDFWFETYMNVCLITDQTVTASQTTLCNSGAVSISTGSSETGVNYFLRNDADSSIVAGPIAGTGSGVTFNTGTINATTTYNVYATKSSAIDLPANTDLVQFSAPFFAYTNTITIEAWVDFKGTLLRAGQSTAGSDNMATNVWLWDVGTFFVNDNGTWRGLLFPTTIPTGWTHVATVADASGMFIYYNGVLVASNTTGITSSIRNNASSVIDLGHDPRFAPSVRNNNHSFDNFRVWNTARTASEVLSNMSVCLTGTEPGLVQYTRFEEGTGTTLNSITGVNGTIVNSLPTAWITGSSVCASCDMEMSQTVTITVNSPTSSIASQTNVNCNGGTNGAATVSVTGGTAPYTYSWSNGSTIATATGLAAGTYSVTITDANACTSVQSVTITEPTALTSSIASQTNVNCNGGTNGAATVSVTGGTAPYTYSWSNGSTIATATGLAVGIYTVTITDANACTSVQSVTITEPAIITGTDVQTACNSYTWIDNVTYTASNNTATHTIVNGAANGCDSVVTLNLTINNSATGTDVQTACNSYTWMDNNTYTSSNNTATHTIVGGAANGCDSVVTLNLTINNSATGTDVQTACNSYTWIDNNTYTTSNNTATYTIVGGATNGCDSVVTLDLTITTVDNSTTLNVNTISANQNSASYQWLDCDNGNAIISGATAQNFTPTVTGNYAVEVTLGSCVDTSTCTNVIITNIDEVGMENINIYPNPTKDDINVELPLNEFTSVEVKIYSVTGKLVYKNAQHNVNKLVINTANWDKGLYFIQLISNNQTITKKIIKQ